jgi:hypothetical protein
MARVISFVAATLIVVTSLIAFSGPAAAHERRMVGPYQLVVGWLNEPAYAVEGLDKTLTVDLQSGGLAPLPLAVTARFGVPGAYNGYALPTATGSYTFTINGKIESLDVNEKFESGPGRFGEIESTDALQYPNKVPVADDLSRRLSDLQGSVDQSRIFALAALVVGIVAIGGAAVMGRRRT